MAIKTNGAVKGFQMLVDRVSLGNTFTTISFHLYVLLKVSWGTYSIYWNVMILNKVLSEIIFITRLFLLKVLSTPKSKPFVCLLNVFICTDIKFQLSEHGCRDCRFDLSCMK